MSGLAGASTLRGQLGTIARTLRAHAFGFAVLTAVLLVGSLVVFGVQAVALLAYFKSIAATVVVDGAISTSGAKHLATISSITTGIAFVLVGLVVAAASVWAAERALVDGSFSKRRAIGRAIRRVPAILGAGVLATFGVAALAVATPFLVNLGMIGLVCTPLARRIQRRRPNLRWPATRDLVIAALPFAYAARQAARWVFVIPAGLERGGPLEVLSASTAATRGRLRHIGATLAVTLGAAVAVQGIAFALVSTTADAGVRGLVFVISVTIAGWMFAMAIAVLYRSTPGANSFAESAPVVEPSGHQIQAVGAAMLILTAVILWPMARPQSAAAASGGGGTYVVNDLGEAPDANVGDGVCATATATCTLAAAVAEVNAAPFGASSDITFSVDGTIPFTQPLMVQKGVVIDGSSHKVTLDGGGTTQLFIFNGEGSTWTLRHVTLANASLNSPGSYGAAINSSATGNVDGVTFIGNDNLQGSGGAIAAWSTLTITNSTFSGNSAATGGADVWSGGTVNITNSTFVGSSGGPIHFDFNGQLDNSIILGALGAFGCDINTGTGGTVTGTNNLGNDASCPGATVPGTITMGTLGDHGGDVATYALGASNPAIDAGASASCPAVDARGVTRPQLGGCDIGAVEYDPATQTVVAATPATTMPGDAVTLQAAVTSVREATGVTGTVTFTDGPTTLGTATLDGAGIATLSVTTLALGAHTITATYNGAPRLSTSSGTTPVTIKPGALSVNLASSQSPSLVGASVTFTATLYLPGPTPATGTVTFADGSTPLATVPLNGATATLNTSSLTLGTHALTATYNGDANYNPATSPSISQQVQANVTIAPTATPSTAVFGNNVTISAHLSSPDTTAVPTGTVLIEYGSIVGTTTLDASGDISFTTDQLPAGTDSVQIIYQGDGTFGFTVDSLDVTITPASTSTTLIVAPAATSVIGATVTLNATVMATGTPAAPTGAVEFFDGATSLGTVTLDGTGAATFTTTALGLGAHQLSAVARTDPQFTTSTSPDVAHQITTVATATSISTDVASAVRGQPVQLRATVTPVGSVAVPTGSVTFNVNGAAVGTATLDASGLATLTVADLSVGSHSINAQYLGAAAFSPSASTSPTFQVDRATATVTLDATPSTGSFGQSITLRATVQAASPGSVNGTGTVTFTDGATTLGSTQLDAGGVATLDVALLAAGSHTLVATFAGDTNLTSGSGTIGVSVNPVDATMMVTATPASVTFGSNVTLTAKVTTATGAIAVGSVTVFDNDSGFSTTVPLDATGTGTVTVDTLSVGVHHLRFNFQSSDVNFTSATSQVTVTKATPVVGVGLDASTIQVGDIVTATAQITGSSVASPTGSVQFLIDGSLVDTEFLTIGPAGSATGTYTFVASSGSHTIRVIYQGNGSYEQVLSNATPFTVGRVTPTVTGSFGASTIYAGQTPNFQATVATAAGHGTPTGAVAFRLDGLDVGTVNLTGGVATMTGPAMTPGSHTLDAVYSGDTTYGAGTATVTAQVQTPPTVVTISAGNPNPKVFEHVTYTVNLNELYGNVPLNGNVWLKVDGVTQTGSGISSGGIAGQVSFDVAVSDAGPHQVTAEFIPSTGAVTGSTGTLGINVARYDATLSLATATPNPQVGQWVTVAVTGTPIDGASMPLNGLITVSDGTNSCVVAAPGGTCTIRWPSAGNYALRATLPESNVYDAAISNPLGITVSAGTPLITARSNTAPWVVGDPIAIDWNVVGPTSGTVTVATTGGHTWCTVAVSAGTCSGSFLDAERSIGSVTVRFDGTVDWQTASTMVTQPVLGCVLVQAGSSVQGTVKIDTAPNCNHGTGYRSWTPLQLTVQPSAGFVLRDFTNPGVNVAGNTATYVVDSEGTGAFTLLTPRFAYACTTLTINSYGPVGVGAFGSPECDTPAKRLGDGYLETQWRQGTTAWVALNGFNVNGTPAVAYLLSGAPSGTVLNGSVYRLTIPMTSDGRLIVRFGAPCYVVDVGVEGGGGAASAQTGGRCQNPFGRAGYAPGTTVNVGYQGVAQSTFQSWSGKPWPLENWVANGANASFTIRGDTSLTAQVQSCHHLTIGSVGFPEDGTVSADTPSNCEGVSGWYLADTQVRVTWASWYFKGWADDQPYASEFSTGAHSGAVWFRLDADRNVTAIFRNDAMCPSLAVTTMPASGAGTATVSGPNLTSDYPCPAGTYPTLTSMDRVPSSCFARYVAQSAQTTDRGLLSIIEDDYLACSKTTPDYVSGKTKRIVHQQWVDFVAKPASGDPLVGWSYATQSPPWVTDPVHSAYSVDELSKPRSDDGSLGADRDVDIYGKTTATAWFCEKITGQAELVNPDGSKKYVSARPGTDYIAVSPAPNCPIAQDAWVVGTTVRLAPAASKAGYAFTHFYGGATGADSTTEITLDGAQQSVKVGISYSLVCHKLTVNSPGDVQKNPAPNCQGVGAGDWYIGGSMVGLNALDRGSDYTWRGWGGDVGTSDNPSWVVMDTDKTANANWYTKNLLDKTADWVSGAYHSVSDFMTHDVADYFASMKDASLVVLATLCKGAQMALQAFTSPTFGFIALPLNVLRLINLALDNDQLASVIDEWSTVLDAMDISNLLLGCAADSVLGLNQGPDDLNVEDAKALKDIGSTALRSYKMYKAGNANEVADPNFGKVAAAGLAIKGGYTAYQIGTSIAEGNIATHGKELTDRYSACINNLVPKRLAKAVAGAVG